MNVAYQPIHDISSLVFPEEFSSCQERVKEFVHHVLQTIQKEKKNILLVSHMTTLNAIHSILLPSSNVQAMSPFGQGEIRSFDIERLVSSSFWNECSYRTLTAEQNASLP